MSLVISGVIDGPLSGGVPKAVEFFALDDIADLSIYGVGSANNGGGSDDEELTLSGSASAGDYVYVASNEDGFVDFFGFAPDFTGSAASINGDDAIELFRNGAVVDVFGEIDVDGTGEPWEYLDGWAYRADDTGPDGTTFVLGNWEFSGPNALDGASSNASAGKPFPVGTFGGTPMAPPVVINELRVNAASGDDTNNFLELFAPDSETSLDGLTAVLVSGEFEPGQIDSAFDLSSGSFDDDGIFLLGGSGVAPGDPGDIFPSGGFDPFGSPQTVFVVEGFTGTAGDDLDTDNDGVLDITPWTAVIDSVSLIDGDEDPDRSYSQTQVGPDGNFVPAGAARDPNGTGAFQILDFFDPSADTPGTENFPEVPAPSVTIMDIQGAGHVSPFVLGNQTTADFFANLPGDTFNIFGGPVTTSGVVTALDDRGFYLQDPDGDGDAATSDAIFVFTDSAPGVGVGDLVEVEATVSEFFPGDTDTRNLPSTQLTNPTVTTLSDGNATVAPTVLANIPDTVIDDDAFGAFQPTLDGIDFFEAIEAMLVTAPGVLATSGTNRFGEIFGVIDQGADASGISSRGTLNISPDDFNPEKIQIDSSAVLPSIPDVDTGALLGDVTGVVSYGFGNFEILPTVDFTPNITPSTLTQDSTALAGDADTLTVASYNVLNLDPIVEDVALVDDQDPDDVDDDEGDGRFAAIAEQIVGNLGAPDIIGLQEIQNNTGAQIDGVSAADVTLQKLADAIEAAGGPVYSFIDTPNAPADSLDANGEPVRPVGGQPGGTIRNAFLYNADRVDLVADSVVGLTDGNETDADGPFFGGRIPLAATFEFNGEEVTLVNAHLSSKGGSAPILGIEQPFDQRQEEPDVNGSLDERQVQAQAINNFVDGIFANNANANVVALGDFNEFEFVSPLAIVAGEEVAPIQVAGPGGLEAVEKVLSNLTETLPEDERYTFNFQGNSQSLDHILVSDSLLAGAAFDIVNTNSEFAATESRASDHDPLVVGLNLGSPTVPEPFTLEVIHITDQETNGAALGDITRASGVINLLQAQDLGEDEIEDNTLLLSSGDLLIGGPFYSIAEDVFGGAGIADIQITNEIGIQAVALGNHEFDFGTAELAGLIDGSAGEDFETDGGVEKANFADLVGTDLEGQDFNGADFPYLSANLDFGPDENLAPLAVEGGQAAQPNVVTSSVIMDVNGEDVGVVGATTPTLANISSPDDVGIFPENFNFNAGDPSSPESVAALDALAAVIQEEVDTLLGETPGLNKVILLSHMQQLVIEQGLATRLENVDIIIGGGSNTRLFDDNDVPRAGDSDQGQYPQFFTNAGGTQTALVNTDGSYKYVGRLVLDFDADGNIVPAKEDGLPGNYDKEISGAYATDVAGVELLAGSEEALDPFIDREVAAIVGAIEEGVIEQEGNNFGFSDVFLAGLTRFGTFTADDPAGVRTQETNLGNLTADANLAYAQEVDETVLVSIKNGGGIRADIGQTVVPAGETEVARLPNSQIVDSDGNVVKPAGAISQFDVDSALSFNNGLTLLTVTNDELATILEDAVGGLPTLDDLNPDDLTGVPGGFPQIAGVKFSFDQDLPSGDRLISAGIFDGDDNLVREVVVEGEVVNPGDTVRLVTLDFLANGGDGSPYGSLEDADRVDLVDVIGERAETGAADFAGEGSEQDALAEFLAANFATSETAFDEEDVGPALDERIQNLAFREDTVFGDAFVFDTETVVEGGRAGDTEGNDLFVIGDGRFSRILLREGGEDGVQISGEQTNDDQRERTYVTIRGEENETLDIQLVDGAEIFKIMEMNGRTKIAFANDDGGPRDKLFVRGDIALTLDGETLDDLSIA